MSLHGLTGVKVPYFKRKYISRYIRLSVRKSFEEEEEQERKAVPLRKERGNIGWKAGKWQVEIAAGQLGGATRDTL